MTIRAEQEITLTRVDDGEEGKSAYEAAIEGGLPSTVTEQEFNEDLADVPELDERIATAETSITTIEGSITNLSSRVETAEGDITTIEGDITTLGGRVSTAESDITTIEGEIGNPEDQASASGSIYARVKNVKNTADQAVIDINAEVTRAQLAEQAAQTAAGNAQTSANQAGAAAAEAQTAAEAAIEANYRKYNAVSWDATTIATKTAHGYSESWARSSAEGYYQGACNVGDVLLIYVTNTSVTPNTVHKLLVRVTAASVAGAPTTGDVISYSSNINAYFWHDNNGAHIQSNANGYRTDLGGNGQSIVNVASGNLVANFDEDSVEFYDEDGKIRAQINTDSGNGPTLKLGNVDGMFVDISFYGGFRQFMNNHIKASCALYDRLTRARSKLSLFGSSLEMDSRDPDHNRMPMLCLDTYDTHVHKGLNYSHPASYASTSRGDEYRYLDNDGELQTIQSLSEYAHSGIVLVAGGTLPTGITNGFIDGTISKKAQLYLDVIRQNNTWVPVIKLYADELTFNDNAIVTTDDSRLSDARTPLSHMHQVSDIIHPYLAGEIKMYAGATIPTGWLLCDGSTFSSEDYPNLATALGDSWGEHSGTTYYLPNLNGRTPVGYDANDTDFDAVGETGGEKTHTLAVNEMPSHSHTPTTSGYKFLSSNANIAVNGTGRNFPSSGGSNHFVYTAASSGEIGESNTTSAVGRGEAYNNMSPYAVVKYIICAY